jgi:hypothetical protein
MVVRAGIPPGTPTLPCHEAVRFPGMIPAAAEPPERTSDKKTADAAVHDFRVLVKRMMPATFIRFHTRMQI